MKIVAVGRIHLRGRSAQRPHHGSRFDQSGVKLQFIERGPNRAGHIVHQWFRRQPQAPAEHGQCSYGLHGRQQLAQPLKSRILADCRRRMVGPDRAPHVQQDGFQHAAIVPRHPSASALPLIAAISNRGGVHFRGRRNRTDPPDRE